MMFSEENLKKCEGYQKGLCFGCDAISDNFYESEEALKSNFFDYYLKNKRCKTLENIKKILVN